MAMNTTRRDFLKTSAAGAAVGTAFWVANEPKVALSNNPLEKLNFACIGVEGKGSSDTDSAGRDGNVVALCDIDESRLNKKARRYPDAAKYIDFRVMLDEMGDKIDAVTVSTPDHTHAIAAATAMKQGKHCFCQKPLTWSVSEARLLRKLAQEHGVATQMGNQGTAANGLREAVEVVRSGAIGNVSEVHVWTNRPVWPQGEGRPTETAEIPEGLHWDLFLGPAPDRPYSPVYHPFKWRGWLDFGTGALGDMACHTANMAVMALDLFDPKTIVADHTGIVEGETYPKSSTITFEFPETEKRGPVTMYWYDGGRKPPVELSQGEKMSNSGSLLVGSKGTLFSPNDYGASYKLLPREQYKDFAKPEQSLPRSPGHFTEFAIACAGGAPAMSNFDYASRLTETILLGNAAMRAGKKLEWDGEKGEFADADANKFLGRDYRDGWSL
ncbi:MAG: Gfo/Idh/MocA family protein [Rubinisphaera brasiliensis]|uniref:Oxidoreductase domain protein n=1 Tax=Rubinisphaera brasiliensis (strain ATCC 49424 / DSM 5305 / JCM 21570 / IAM 15109 / NBRC 103401 / IFAM 1448) TaxID=756272 RepID=F0SP33_RUBBR|nr:Gfo/Idh/MocA family oxidoreductase [Rubinisphaera brasiliensis]ADY61136.1 oxidoreductase domain protein [Rubinisphaera brasiliensis DSM 5305]